MGHGRRRDGPTPPLDRRPNPPRFLSSFAYMLTLYHIQYLPMLACVAA